MKLTNSYFTTLALLCAAALPLIQPSSAVGAPGVVITQPAAGTVVAPGSEIYMQAQVDSEDKTLSAVGFESEGAPLGTGVMDVHGNWHYPQGHSLSVMPGDQEMIDFMAYGGEFFAMGGRFTSLWHFEGTFTTWDNLGAELTGNAIVDFTFSAEGLLTAVMHGDAPLGSRTLTDGGQPLMRKGSGVQNYAFYWQAPPAGAHVLTATAQFSDGSSATSEGVSITVKGPPVPTPDVSTQLVPVTDTAPDAVECGKSGHQLVVQGQNIHVAWIASNPEQAPPISRLYYRRSTDGGRTFEAPVLVDSSDVANRHSYLMLPTATYLAVEGNSVHLALTLNGGLDPQGTSYPTELCYYRSLNGGTSFEDRRVLGTLTPGGDSGPMGCAYVAAAEGKVTIAFLQVRATEPNPESHVGIGIFNSQDGGATFLHQTVHEAMDYTGPVIGELRASGQDVVLSVSDFQSPGFGFNRAGHYCAVSTNGGASFVHTTVEPFVPQSGVVNLVSTPRVAKSGTNVFFLYGGFLDENAPFGSLFLRRSTDHGVSFGPRIELAAAGMEYAKGDSDTVLSVQGDAVMVLFRSSVGRLLLRRSTDRGATFAPIQDVASGWNSDVYAFGWPSLTVDPLRPQRVHVMWDGRFHCYSTNGGVGFLPPVQLSTLGATTLYAGQGHPRHGVDGEGLFHFLVDFQYAIADRNDAFHRRFHPVAPAGISANQALHLYQNQNESRLDNVQIPAGDAMQFSNVMSVELWVRLQSDEAETPVILQRLSVGAAPWYSVSGGFELNTFIDQISSGVWRRFFGAGLYTTDGYYTVGRKAENIAAGVWHHVAFTYDAAGGAGNLRLYVDGDLAATNTVTGQLLPGRLPVWVGAPTSAGPTSAGFNGAIDDLRFWNRALTIQEIRNRFTSPLQGNEPGLAAYYPFNGTPREATGRGLDGVLMYKETFAEGADVKPFIAQEILAGGQLKLSWITFSSSPYVLQQTGDLAHPNWQPVGGSPILINGRFTQTVSTLEGMSFYRLRR